MKPSRIFKAFVCIFWSCALSLPTYAQDTLDQVLQRLSIKNPVAISYKQTRQLQLLQSPWQGSGEIYLSTGKMIIAQQIPKQLFISITADTLEYLDTKQNIYHLKKLKGAFELPQLAVFVDLIYGQHNATSLQKKYITQFKSNTDNWYINLSDENDDDVETVELSGPNGAPANRLEMRLSDGDVTSWEFLSTTTAVNIDEKMSLIGKRIRDYKNTDQLESLNR